MIDVALAEAYRRTGYVVWPLGRAADEPFVLRHGLSLSLIQLSGPSSPPPIGNR